MWKSTNSSLLRNKRETTFRVPMNFDKRKRSPVVSKGAFFFFFNLTYLSETCWWSLFCAMQIDIGPTQHDVVRFLHLDEREQWPKCKKNTEKHRKDNSDWKQHEKLNTDFALDVNSVALLPHLSLQRLAWYHRLHKTYLMKTHRDWEKSMDPQLNEKYEESLHHATAI